MQDESFANSALRDLRELGMQLVLDNFDAGYSWLSYIYKYTFDSLKIDRSNLYPIFTIKNQAFSYVIDYDQPRAEFEEVQGFWFTQALKPEDVTQLLLSNCSESHPKLYWENKLT